MFGSVVEAIADHGEHLTDKIAIITDNSEVTYGELWQRIQRCSALLSERGIKSGDKIVLAEDYAGDFIALYFAIHWLGATSVVVEREASVASITSLIDSISPKLIVLNRLENGVETYKILEDAHGTCSRGVFTEKSWADILYTTGTTGIPKGVVLSHKNEVAGALNVINGGDMSEQDRNLLTMPLHHAFGLTTLRAVLYKGGTVILQEGFASLKKMNDNIKNKACNCVYMVPAALRVIYFQTRERLDLLLGALEKIEFCTAPLDKKMRRVLNEQLKGVRLYNSYGATESARSVYMRLDLHLDKEDAIGRAVKGVSVHIVDDDHKEVVSSRQNIGHLAIHGDMNMIGYYNDPRLTETVLSKGVFYSEDLGYMDEEGYIYLSGRNNDVINIGGEKVSPIEIENAALDCEGVEECACIGIKDPQNVLGYVPLLFVVSDNKEDFSDIKIRTYIERHLENYKVPYRIIEVDEIPKNFMGKIDRKKLDDLWQLYIQE